ncbi:MAG: PEP-utilizing enzyme [Acidimicrobiales bacterium]
METGKAGLARRPQSVLVATAISVGCRQQCFKAGTGLDYGVEIQRFESSAPSISTDDEDRLVQAITKRADSEPSFWWDYVRRAIAIESRLISTVRSAASFAEKPRSHQELREAAVGVTKAMQAMAPFIVAMPLALGLLQAAVSDQVIEESGATEAGGAEHEEILARLQAPWLEPDPVREMRSGYRIALHVQESEEANSLFVDTAPRIAVERVSEGFPELSQMIRNHVDEFGWLRTVGYRFDPLSPEALVYRIQLVARRWTTEATRRAAAPEPVPTAEEVLGFTPSESLAERITALQAILTQRCFRVDVELQAECIARPLWARIADALGCTTSQILFVSPGEVLAGLAHQGKLPVDEIDTRARNGFSVARDHDAMEVHAEASTPSDRGASGGQRASGGQGGGQRGSAGTEASGVLTGMTACRGTAVGRVKIVSDQADLDRLEIGDVLVTASSTIDPTDTVGEGTVFPTRTGGPRDQALERVAAVVADEGGLLSHAAIVCRERGLTCVLGTETATRTLSDGQVVEVDATKPVGIVIRLLPD